MTKVGKIIRGKRMIPTEYSKLIGKLYEKSQKMKVKWLLGKNHEEFLVHFKHFGLSLKKTLNNNSGKLFFDFNILNENKECIDSFSVGKDEEDAPLIQDLYYVARRKAYRIDEAIRSMLEELDE